MFVDERGRKRVHKRTHTKIFIQKGRHKEGRESKIRKEGLHIQIHEERLELKAFLDAGN